jgi:hypothetical protein
VIIALFSEPQHLLWPLSGELLEGDESPEAQYPRNRPVRLFPVSRTLCEGKDLNAVICMLGTIWEINVVLGRFFS